MIQQEKIEIALNSIRPFLQRDGGDVEFVSVDNDIVSVRLVGACETCSMQASTLKAGIEESIMNAIPEVKGVISV
ncbi:MAG: NifU family protein [Crocinitomicaceae bacterium]